MNFTIFLFILCVCSSIVFILRKFNIINQYNNLKIINNIISYLYSMFPIFIFIFLLRTFVIEPFFIPSGSLEPTLLIGDFIIVNKFIYGIRIPIIEKKIISISYPKRGDVVVFQWPPDHKFNYIKRIIGIPGDKISYHNKILTLNDKLISNVFLNNEIDESTGKHVKKFKESFGERYYHNIYLYSNIVSENFDLIVPKHCYFVMGDNRDNSSDSRFWGFVEDKYLIGKAFAIWMSWNNHDKTIRWNRIGNIIH